MTFPDEEPEPSKGGDYPIDDAEREAAGLPPLSSDRRDKPQPPQPVAVSFLLWIASAVLLVAGFVLMVVNRGEITAELLDAYDEALRAGDPITGRSGVTRADVEAGVPKLLWALAVGAAMMAALIVLFAYKTREGTRSGRVVLAALLAVFVVFAIGMPDAFVNWVMVASVIVGAAALVLLFLPGVAGYFPRLPKTTKRWRDYS